MNAKNHHAVYTQNNQLSLFSETKKEQQQPILDTVFQYFLIISPPNQVKSKVKSLKYKLHKAVGLSDYNLQSEPHISLMSFHTMRPVNERFFNALQQLFSNNAFEIDLNGFEYFEHGEEANTIYVKIENSYQIVKVYHELHRLLGLNVREFVPHLTVAKTMSRTRFNKSYEMIKQHSFSEKFNCNQVTILERKLQHGVVSNYRVIKEIEFNESSVPHP
jgi:2'-5' RNA ligase